MVIDMVLATDLAMSLEITNRFRLQTQQEDGAKDWLQKRDGVSLVLQMALKLCDIGHAGKPLMEHIEWSRRVMHEFIGQGELERELGLPISPLCDINTYNLPKSQIGFLQFVALPCFRPWCEFAEQPELLAAVNSNHEYWVREAGDQKSSSVAPSTTPVTGKSPSTKPRPWVPKAKSMLVGKFEEPPAPAPAASSAPEPAFVPAPEPVSAPASSAPAPAPASGTTSRAGTAPPTELPGVVHSPRE